MPRRNPSLVTFLANPRGRAPIASDVQAILYRHATDGQLYIHTFGNQGDARIVSVPRLGEVLVLDSLPDRTGVRLRADGNDLHLTHGKGKPLSAEFE
jgi:hypothetical protein